MPRRTNGALGMISLAIFIKVTYSPHLQMRNANENVLQSCKTIPLFINCAMVFFLSVITRAVLMIGPVSMIVFEIALICMTRVHRYCLNPETCIYLIIHRKPFLWGILKALFC